MRDCILHGRFTFNNGEKNSPGVLRRKGSPKSKGSSDQSDDAGTARIARRRHSGQRHRASPVTGTGNLRGSSIAHQQGAASLAPHSKPLPHTGQVLLLVFSIGTHSTPDTGPAGSSI